MKSIVALGLLTVSGVAFAGDCGGLFSGFGSRRANRREARAAVAGSCANGSCGSASTAKTVEETPAVIRTESVYQTRKVAEKVTIAPASGATKKTETIIVK